MPKTLDMTPTWGEVGILFGRLATTKQASPDVIRLAWPEAMRAFAMAEALTMLIRAGDLNPAMLDRAGVVYKQEMDKARAAMPGLSWKESDLVVPK